MADLAKKPLLAMAVLLGLLNADASRAQSQTAGAAPLTFEVASIKSSDPNNPDSALRRSNARFAAKNHTLKRLIAFACE